MFEHRNPHMMPPVSFALEYSGYRYTTLCMYVCIYIYIYIISDIDSTPQNLDTLDLRDSNAPPPPTKQNKVLCPTAL